MNRLHRLQQICIFLAGTILAASYTLIGHWRGAWIFLAGSLIWWYGRRAWPPIASIGLTFFTLAAVVGIWTDQPPLLMLLVVVIALAGWDLDGLEQRLRWAKDDSSTQTLLHQHLKKLSTVVIAGILIAGIAMPLHMRLNFWIVFFLALMLAFSLRWAFLALREDASTTEKP